MVSIAAFQAVDPGSIPGRRMFLPNTIEFVCSCTRHMFPPCGHGDEVAEWLRRWTANPMGSARVGSNPILVEFFSMANKIIFRYRESNSGHLGESQIS